MAKISLPYVKTVKAKGRLYYYFDTGERKPNGAAILARLPDISSTDFGTRYSNLKAVRTKSENRKNLPSVGDLIRLYETSGKFKSLAPKTRDAYLIYMKRMAGIFLDPKKGSWPAINVTRPDVRDLLDELGPAAQKMQLAVFRQVYQYADKQDKIPANFNPSKGVDVDHKAIPHEAWPDTLVELALASPVALPVALLYFTGQRIGAVARMRWADIQDGVLNVPPFKTTRILNIPLHTRLLAMLAKEERGITTIINKDGKPVSKDALYSRIKVWLISVDAGQYTPHGLRKCAVNTLLEAGCTVSEVSSITGQTLQMVEHYAKQRDDLKLARRAMGKWEDCA